MSKATIRPIQLRPEERCDCGEPLAGRCIACTVSAYQSERASPSAADLPQEADLEAIERVMATLNRDQFGWSPIATAPKGIEVVLANDVYAIVADWSMYTVHNAPKFSRWMALPPLDVASCHIPPSRATPEGELNKVVSVDSVRATPAYRTASCDWCCGGTPFAHVLDCPFASRATSAPQKPQP